MAEGWLRHFAAGRAEVFSAGVEARGLNPRAVAAMAEAGVDISRHTSDRINPHKQEASIQKYLGEFIGTFALVFAGTGSIIVNDTSGGAVIYVGVAMTFGLIVMAMIYSVGKVSGASMNPARSLAPALVSGNLSGLWIYLTAPFAGAIIAVIACRFMRDESTII